MQFFGARVNLAKTLLYAINGGRDENTGDQVGAALPPLTGDVLDYSEVVAWFEVMMNWPSPEQPGHLVGLSERSVAVSGLRSRICNIHGLFRPGRLTCDDPLWRSACPVSRYPIMLAGAASAA